jgi:transketolase N-terminal domain/subunit
MLSEDDVVTILKPHSLLNGHTANTKVPGVETSTTARKTGAIQTAVEHSTIGALGLAVADAALALVACKGA